MLNRIMIIGRLGQDPQLKYSQTGTPIATFSVATDENYTDRDGARQQRTEWFRVVVFQKTAENCSRYLHKGSLVYVEGSLQTRKWQDQQGIDRTLVEIRGQRVDFLDRRSQNEDMGQRSYQHPSQEPYGSEPQGGYRQSRPDHGGEPAYQPPYEGSSSPMPFSEPEGPAGEPAMDQQMTGPSEGSEEASMDKVPF